MKFTNFKILWYLNDICNQQCHYCISKENRDNKKNRRISIYELENLRECLLTINPENLELVLLGGEPTLSPDLYNVVEFFIDNWRGISINLSSNFKNGIPEELIKYRDSIIFRFSMHPQYFSSKWRDIVSGAISNKLKLVCNLMFDKKYEGNTMNAFDYLCRIPKSEYFSFELKRIIPEFSPKNSAMYTDKITEQTYNFEDFKLLKLFGNGHKKRELNKKYCLVGSNKIGIDSDGNFFYLCNYSKVIGNSQFITPMKFRENIFSIYKCPFKYCSCAGKKQPIQSNLKSDLMGYL